LEDGLVKDTSGRGNDGVMVGATYSAADKAFSFSGANGSNIRLSSTTPFPLNTDPDLSFSVWVKVDVATSTAWRGVFDFGNRGASENVGVFIPASSNGVGPNQFNFTLWGSDLITGEAVEANRWYHLAGAYTAATKTRQFYVDGILKGTVTTSTGMFSSLDPANPPLILGTNSTSGYDEGLAGKISNFKLYDTALTASEVKTLYDMGRCDEGHHVVNFSKTRVGIGLGDGEVPRVALDVRGDIYGGCPVFFEVYAGANTGSQAYMNFNEQGVVKGGGWTADTTKFYAPVSGYYKFDISMMGTYLNGRGTRIEWRLNGTKYPDNTSAEMYDYQSAGVTVHLRVSGNTIAYLNVGDWMGIYNTSNDINNRYGKFTGFYLSS
jgi:hypothetical protein